MITMICTIIIVYTVDLYAKRKFSTSLIDQLRRIINFIKRLLYFS